MAFLANNQHFIDFYFFTERLGVSERLIQIRPSGGGIKGLPAEPEQPERCHGERNCQQAGLVSLNQHQHWEQQK